jgi:hypothetical protein
MLLLGNRLVPDGCKHQQDVACSPSCLQQISAVALVATSEAAETAAGAQQAAYAHITVAAFQETAHYLNYCLCAKGKSNWAVFHVQ